MSLFSQEALNLVYGEPQGAAPSNVQSFVDRVAPLAQTVGERLNVDPAILIGQWGLETGWGKSVVPGTNNLGNIKDFSGRGPMATDNMTGSRDAYRAYDSLDAFGDDYASLIERRYRGALGAGSDAEAFARALKSGGYAEDPDYVAKMVRAARMAGGVPVSQRRETPYQNPLDALPQGGNSPMQRALEQDARQQAADDSPIWTSFSRGWEGLKHNAGLFVDTLADDAESAAQRIAAKREYDAANPAPTSSQEFLRQWDELADDDYLGMLATFARNPGGAVNQMVEQTPNSLPGLALQIPTAIASGALFATGWGAPLAIALQGAAAFAGNVLPEGGAFVEEQLSKSGVDTNNPAAVAQWLSENRDANLAGGATKAGVISLADGVAGYLGGKLIAGPSARFGMADRTILRNAGVDVADRAAANAFRATEPYRRAIAPAAQELLDATTGAQKLLRATGAMGLESFGEGAGEYGGSLAATGEASAKDAVLEAAMGFGQSTAMTGANALIGKMQRPAFDRVAMEKLAASGTPPAAPKPNSPLQNAANAAAASAPPAAPGAMIDPVADPAAEQEPAEDPRLARARSFVEDRNFISALRGAEGFGKESVTDLLSAYAKARNPNVDPLMRERALADLDAFIDTFVNRPNFTFGKSESQQGTTPGQSVVPASPAAGQVAPFTPAAPADDGMTLDGEFRTPSERMAGANPNQLAAPPVLGLPTEEALQARRDAEAAYDQAFQDLVKAEQLGASEAELGAYQRALFEADAQRKRLDAELAAADARVADARERESQAARRAILASLIEQGVPAVNPVSGLAASFTAALQQQGYGNIVPTADEMRTIQRAVDVANAQGANVEPAAPNEMPAELVPARAPTVTPTAPRGDKTDEAVRLLSQGWKLNGKTLVSPRGKRRILNLKEQEAVRNAQKALRAGLDPAAALPGAAQSEAQAAPGTQGVVPAAPVATATQEGGVTDNVPTTEQVAAQAAEAATDVEQQSAIERHGLPEGTTFSRGKGMASGKWIARAGDTQGNMVATIDEAASSLAQFLQLEKRREENTAAMVALSKKVADKLKRGEQPTDVELRDLFGLDPRHTYVKQSAVGQFLVDYMGVPRNKIRESLGKAAGTVTSDSGTKYPIVYPRKLHEVFGATKAADDAQAGDKQADRFANNKLFTALDAAAHEAATSPLNDLPQPTDAQKEAGNYVKGSVRLHGMDISIENPQGSVRSGTAPDGTRWENRIAHHYGYIKGSRGADNDQIDVFLTDGAEEATVAWVIDQKNDDGSFDEHKAVIGPKTEDEARAAYLANYDEGWDGLGAITSMPMEAFKAWALDGKRKRKALAYTEPSAVIAPSAIAASTAVRDATFAGVALNRSQDAEIANGGSGLAGELNAGTLRSLVAMRNNPNVPSPRQDEETGSYSPADLPTFTDVGDGFSVRGYALRQRVVQEIKLPNGMVARRVLNADGTVYGEFEGNYDQIVGRRGFTEAQRYFAKFAESRAQKAEATDISPDTKSAEAAPQQAEAADTAAVPQPLTSIPFATFEQLKTALKVLGDVPAIQERLRNRNIANIPGKGWVNVPNKLRWDEVRANIPVRIETYRLDGVPARLADVTLEVMESGAVTLKSRAEVGGYPDAATALRKYVENYKDAPEAAEADSPSFRTVKSKPFADEASSVLALMDRANNASTSQIASDAVRKLAGMAQDSGDATARGIGTFLLDNALEALNARKINAGTAGVTESRPYQQLKASIERLRDLEIERVTRGDQAPAVAPDQSTHKDPGQPAEPVTQPVIAQAIQRSARNTAFDPVEAKAWILGEIDRAIAAIPERNAELAAEMARAKASSFDYREAEKKYGKNGARNKNAWDIQRMRDDRIEKIARQIGYVTFDVPGDGKFKVLNTVEKLRDFRAKVEKSPGFAKNPDRPSRFGGQGLAGAQSLDQQVADAKKFGGDPLADIGNAIEIARLKDGKDEDRLLDRFKEASGGKDYDTWRAEQEAAEEIAAREAEAREQANQGDPQALAQMNNPAPAPAPAPSKLDAAAVVLSDKKRAAAEKLKRLLDSRKGTLNSGIDPELMLAVAELGAVSIAEGAVKFAQWARDVIQSARAVGIESEQIKPFLKEAYGAIAANPEKYDLTEDQAESMDALRDVRKTDVDALTSDNQGADKGATARSLSNPDDKFDVARDVADHFIGGGSFKTIVEARKFIADRIGQKIEPATELAKQADETVETGVVLAAREIVASGRKQGRSDQVIYDRLLSLYEAQPNLAVRSSTSVRDQAYSTPVPLAFVASRLAGISDQSSVYEPTAGNGALVLGSSPDATVVNELNPARAEMLKRVLPGANVRSNNAANWKPPQKFASIIMNPPFGATKDANGNTIYYDVLPNYSTREVDHAIAFKALETLEDDGRAVLIVGGVDARSEEGRREGYRGKSKREFYYHLYDQFNVTDHFTVDGDMYAKQGAGYPVDVIVIQGRGKSSRYLPAADLPQIIGSYVELKEKLNEADRMVPAGNVGGAGVDRGAGDARASDTEGLGRGAGSAGGRDGVAQTEPDASSRAGDENARIAGRDEPAASGRGAGEVQPSAANGAQLRDDRQRPVPGAGKTGDGGGKAGTRNRPGDVAGVGVVDGERVQSGLNDRRGQEQETALQVAYEPRSQASSVGTLVPKNMRDAIQDSLEKLEQQWGGVDGYVAEALNYDVDTLKQNFSAEQIDALALAIQNAVQGRGFIIGDQTGIGKGRVVAAMIRYALVSGKTPIFVTEKPNLYADMIRDMDDIGMTEELGLDRGASGILITNGSESIPYTLLRQKDGEVVENVMTLRAPASGKALDDRLRAMRESGDLGQYKVIFTTYNQLQTVKGKETERQRFVKQFGAGGYMIFDESHNAGGAGETQARTKEQREAAKAGATLASGRAAFVRELVRNADGTFFSSATYAKRPDVMDLYSSTNMLLAVNTPADLAPAIKQGGVPMQQVVAAMLTKDGQYIRRERTFAGVSYDTVETSVDQATAENMASAMRSILAFSRAKESVVKAIQEELDKSGALASSMNGESVSVQGANFGSIMHNLIDQMLLSLKAQQSVAFAIERLKEGEKVVLTVSNTMGSFLKSYADEMELNTGDPVALSFKDLYLRYLEKQRYISVKRTGEAKGTPRRLTDDELGPALTQMFNQIAAQIENSGFGAAPISPIDYLHAELRKAGYKTDEITGRTVVLDYSRGTPRLGSRTATIKQRLQAISGFNNGDTDVIILNQSGSTGLSLHASSKFKDQRKRHMIIVQAEKNIDTHMQMLGRVHRTGQVRAPAYSQMMADVPAEMRPAAVLMKKMAALNANTTASRESAVTADGVIDFMNDYGGQVVHEYLTDNPDVLKAIGGSDVIKLLADPTEATEDDIRKFTGYIPVLPIKQQEEIYSDLIERYRDLIERENSMGTNKLEARALDLDAVTVDSEAVTPERGGDSEFARPAFMERVDVKRTVKPFSTKEVRDMVAERLGDRTADQIAAAMIEDLRVKATEYAQARVEELRLSGADDMRLSQERDKFNAQYADAKTRLSYIKIGEPVAIVSGDGQVVHGVVIDIQNNGKTKNPLAGSAWKVSFALANGESRTMNATFSQIGSRFEVRAERRVNYLNPETGRVEIIDAYDMFDQGTTTRREKRWMVTGNILAGFAAYPGQIVNYTRNDGTTQQGVMMPRIFDYNKIKKNAKVPMRNGEMASDFLNQAGLGARVGTADLGLQIENRDYVFTVTVPASKREGGTYYLDRKLTDALGVDFYKNGSRMIARISDQGRLSDAINYLTRDRGINIVALSNQDVARKIAGLEDVKTAPPAVYEIDENGDPSAEEAQAVQAGIERLNPIEAADWLAQNAPPQYATIAAKVRDKLESLRQMGVRFGLQIVRPGDTADAGLSRARGATWTTSRDGRPVIMIALNGADMKGRVGTSYRTALHELSHAATLQSIRLGEQGYPQYAQAAYDLRDVANAVVAHINRRASESPHELTEFERAIIEGRANFLSSLDEVVTWALTSPDAQAYLESIPYKRKSLWTAFVEAVRKLLGLSAQGDTALSEVLRVSEVFLQPVDAGWAPASLPRAKDGRRYEVQQPADGAVFKSPGGMPDTFVTNDGPAVFRAGDTMPDTITVDGIKRPTANSEGRPIHPSVEGIRNFWRWFGESAVTDDQGRPLVVYHGTTEDVADGALRPGEDAWSDGIFFTDSAQIAASVYARGTSTPNTAGVREALARMSDAQLEDFAERLRSRAGWGDFWLEIDEPAFRQPYADQIAEYADNTFDHFEGGTQAIDTLAAELGINARMPAEGANVMPSYLSLQDPMMVDGSGLEFDPEQQAEWIAQAKAAGHDGLVIRNYSDGGFGIGNDFRSAGRHDVFVAFQPEQAKSATGNNGDFSASPSVSLRTANEENLRVGFSRVDADRFIEDFLAATPNAPEIVAVNTFDQLPAFVQQEARNQGETEKTVKGVLVQQDGVTRVYVVVGNHASLTDFEATIFHEVAGHFGMREMLGPDFTQKLNQIYLGVGGQGGLVKIMNARGLGKQAQNYIRAIQQAKRTDAENARKAAAMGRKYRIRWTDAVAKAVLTEEVYAHIAEQLKDRPALLDKFKTLIGALRQWLRDHTFMRLASLGETDLLYMLSKARKELQGPSGGPKGGRRTKILVSDRETLDRDGERLDRADPDLASAMMLARGLGLQERDGVAVFAEQSDQDAAPGGSESQSVVFRVGDSATIPRDERRDYLAGVASRNDGPLRQFFTDLFAAFKSPSSKVFGPLHKSISTQLHKAWVNKDYGEVFYLADRYERDISRFSAEPSALAPKLLPTFDKIGDAFDRMIKGDKVARMSGKVANAIFEGTLAGATPTEGRVWTDQELRDRFELDDAQIELYREARKTTDLSLDISAAGLAWQMVKKYIGDLKEAVRTAPADAAKTIELSMRELEDQLREEVQMVDGMIADAENEGEAAKLTADRSKLMRKAQEVAEARIAAEGVFKRAEDLKAGGYFPLMRFGKYNVDVTIQNEDGETERLGFYKFETEAEAKMAEQRLRREFPEANIERSISSEEAWKVYQGVDPETVALFAEHIGSLEGLDVKDDVLQAWYREAVNNRSAFKRMIHRKGTEGFDRDLTRVLASFVTSNARLAARQFNMPDIDRKIADLKQQKAPGDVVDEAERLRDYIENPEEPFQSLKGWMFAWFLGGSISSALLNATQPFMVTLPYLSQFGATQAAAELTKAMKGGASGKVTDADLQKALLRAAEDGKVDPQQVHHLFHEGMRPFISKLPFGQNMRARAQGLMTAWGYLFGWVENFNRRSTFIAAYRMAKANPKLGDAYEFAVRAVDETQGVYGKSNRPNWARGVGPFGGLGVAAFVFKQYSIAYVELLIRMAKSGPAGKRAALMQLGILVMLAGLQGFPGAEDLEDLIDTAAQHMGYTGNSRLELHRYLKRVLGEEFGNIVQYGLLSAPMLRGDMSSRVGLGDLFPATAIFKPSQQNRASQIAELFGPPASMGEAVMKALEASDAGGGALGILKALTPVAVSNAWKGVDMAVTGRYNDTRGRKVVEVDMLDAVLKGVGIQPSKINAEQRPARLIQMSAQRVRQVKSNIHNLRAQAIVEKNADKRRRADEMLRDWNAKNPDARLSINSAAILRRVKEMNAERRARLMKTLPKELRQSASEEYAQ